MPVSFSIPPAGASTGKGHQRHSGWKTKIREPKPTRSAASTLMPVSLAVPLPPLVNPEDDRTIYMEQQSARVEVLMLKGVRDQRIISELLEIPRHQVTRMCERVKARWEVAGTTSDLGIHRGEALHRLDLIENELWSVISQAKDPKVKIVSLKQLIEVQSQRSDLLGLTTRVIERLTSGSAGAIAQFNERVDSHERMSRIASKMLQMLHDRTGMKVINGNDQTQEVDVA